MADDNNQSLTVLASAGVILIALVSMGTYFFRREPPLVSSRPAMTEEGNPDQTGAQQHKISARLWQDPLAAVAKSLDKSEMRDLEQRCLQKPSDESACRSPLTEMDEGTLVLGVTASESSYPEDAKRRRLTRYAVLAGLERAGFVPSDARHFGYFMWTRPVKTLAQINVEPSAPPQQQYAKPDRRKSPARLPQLYQERSNPYGVTTIAPAQQIVVPYEWFANASEFASRQRVLVLWLSEEAFKDRPLQKISELKTFLGGKGKFKIVGPGSSDMLHDMVLEACPFVVDAPLEECRATSNQDNRPDLNNVHFYAYGASASDSQLLGKLSEAGGTVEDYFGKLNIQLQRTIGTDDTLARGIKVELGLRNAKVGPESDGDLALIFEWDTLLRPNRF